MLVNGKHYHTIWLDPADSTKVEFINQLLLPFEFKTETMVTVGDVYDAIKSMKVRGAPLIGVTGAFGIYLACLELQRSENFDKDLQDAAAYLTSARPTAVNLSYAINRSMQLLTRVNTKDEKIETAKNAALSLSKQEVEACRKIGEFGVTFIEELSRKKQGETVNILTHCNAGWLACIDYGTATAPVYEAFNRGVKVHVWVDETRPRNQGARLTAWELGQHGVPHTIIADNNGGHLMQHGLVDMCIVGSDRTTASGDVANKIGTYLKALAAADNDIPFYIALPSSSIDFSIEDGLKDIEIEQRSTNEVARMEGIVDGRIQAFRIVPESSPCRNDAFDVTPARLVSRLITEKGVCEASKAGIQQLFPEKF